MQQIIIPGTSIKASRLGLGTASLHHLFQQKARRRVLSAALDSGYTHFDTAPMYGEGMAERELGRYLGSTRKQVTIATKVGYPAIPLFEHLPPLLYAHRALGNIGRRIMPAAWNYRPRMLGVAEVDKSLARSMKALQTDWIDLLLIHEPTTIDVAALQRLASWLEAQKANGRVRYLGLAGRADDCLEVIKHIPNVFDLLQVEDSLTLREADAVIEAGRPLQITFGYLRRGLSGAKDIDGENIIRDSLSRNVNGLILVSSRNPLRLQRLALLANKCAVSS